MKKRISKCILGVTSALFLTSSFSSLSAATNTDNNSYLVVPHIVHAKGTIQSGRELSYILEEGACPSPKAYKLMVSRDEVPLISLVRISKDCPNDNSLATFKKPKITFNLDDYGFENHASYRFVVPNEVIRRVNRPVYRDNCNNYREGSPAQRRCFERQRDRIRL